MSFNLPGQGVGRCVMTGLTELNLGSIAFVNAVGGGCGNGVFVGCEEEEFPVVVFGLVADQFADFFHRVVRGCIFITIRIDCDDHFSRAVFFRGFGEFFADVVNGASDGVEQGCASSWGVGVRIKRADICDGCAVGVKQVFIVEENEGEVCVPWSFLLVLEKGVKAGDGGLNQWLHGA